MILEKTLEDEKALLTEPDESPGDEEAEASAGGVAGVSVPLGAGPNYPNRTRRPPGIRSPIDSAAASFGNGKVAKRKK